MQKQENDKNDLQKHFAGIKTVKCDCCAVPFLADINGDKVTCDFCFQWLSGGITRIEILKNVAINFGVWQYVGGKA